MSTSIFRVSAEFLLRIDDEGDARLLAADALHTLVSETQEAGVGTEGDADEVLKNLQAVVNLLVREILNRGSESLGCTSVDNMKINNEPVDV